MTFSDYIDYLRDKRIGVIGFGVSNQPLVRVLLRSGCDVTVCDRRERAQLGAAGDEAAAQGAKFALGADYLEHLDFDVIFRTPGVLPIVPQLRKAAQNGAILTSEMEAFCNLCPCRILAITGSDGKTTTSTITAELLRAQGHTVHLGGNIGTPLFDRIPDIRPEDFAVLELSSFQLHSMHCAPDVATSRTFRRTIWMCIRILRTMCQPSAAFTVVSGRTAYLCSTRRMPTPRVSRPRRRGTCAISAASAR